MSNISLMGKNFAGLSKATLNNSPEKSRNAPFLRNNLNNSPIRPFVRTIQQMQNNDTKRY